MKMWELFNCVPVLEEASLQVFGRTRKGKSIGKKFRCTSGPRKGRVVADPATCNKPINIAARIKAKQSRPKYKTRAGLARSRTLRTNPITKAIMKRNLRRKSKLSKRR